MGEWIGQMAVVTEHSPLTDDELAAMDRVYADLWSATVESQIPLPNVPRLIADLRASRAEVERLRAEITSLKAEIRQLEQWVPNGW